MEKLYLDQNIEIYYNDILNAIEVKWLGDVITDTFKQKYDMIPNFFNNKKAKKYLIDRRDSKHLPLEIQDWLADYWVPKMIKLGLEAMCTILPKGAIAKVSLNQLLTSVLLNKSSDNSCNLTATLLELIWSNNLESL